jgi:hypothetical protein
MAYLESIINKENSRLKTKTEGSIDKDVSLKFLTNLIDYLGLDKAIDFVSKYDVKNLVSAEAGLDKKEFFDVKDDMTKIYYMADFNDIATDLAGHPIDQITTYKDYALIMDNYSKSGMSTHLFWRSILRNMQKIIESYSLKATRQEALDEGLFNFASLKSFDGGIEYIPNVTTSEILEFLLSNKDKEYDPYDIEKGFDDWKIAFEASKEPRAKRNFLLHAGLTSMEALKLDVSHKILNDGMFESGANYSKWNLKEWINKDINKFQEFSKVFDEDKNAVGAMNIFKGNVGDYMQYAALEEKPSLEAIACVQRNFGVKDFDKIITTAKGIDNPNDSVFYFADDKGEYPKSIDEFKTLLKSYNEINEKYKQATGSKEDLGAGQAEFARENPDAMPFVNEFNVYDDAGKEHIKLVARVLTYDEWKSIKLPYGRDEKVVEWIKGGYSKDRILDLGQISGYYDSRALQLMQKEGPTGAQINNILERCPNNEMKNFATVYELFGDPAEHKIPYTMIRALAENHALVPGLRDFTYTQGIERYWDDKGFNGVQFIRDYRLFYNIDEEKSDNKV